MIDNEMTLWSDNQILFLVAIIFFIGMVLGWKCGAQDKGNYRD